MAKPREKHISDRLVQLCTSNDSVSSLLAEDPSLAPGDAWERLYGGHVLKTAAEKAHKGDHTNGSTVPGATPGDELERAARCGKWGPTKPGELFLRASMAECCQGCAWFQMLTWPQIYHDALCALGDNPLRGMVSPSLLGSCGVVPLTIISVYVHLSPQAP